MRGNWYRIFKSTVIPPLLICFQTFDSRSVGPAVHPVNRHIFKKYRQSIRRTLLKRLKRITLEQISPHSAEGFRASELFYPVFSALPKADHRADRQRFISEKLGRSCIGQTICTPSPAAQPDGCPVAVQDLRPGISSPQRRLGRLSNSGWTRKQNPSPSDFYIRTMKQKGSFLSQHNGKSDIVKQYRCAEKSCSFCFL